MRVEPWVRYPPRHAKRDGERRNEVGPLTWWGIVGVVRPKSLMPTTPHGLPAAKESFVRREAGIGVASRSNPLC